MSKDEMPRENFPGGESGMKDGELRVSVDHKAYAEVLSHAKEEADIEICGIFIGKVKQDKNGPWLHIQHTIRGENAKGQGAHVTFTHETWNHINKVWDTQYPSLGIVGWYHTHPSFDIFLSDMDKFIHKSYFDNPNQVAYVYDPHQGTEGFFRKIGEDIKLLDRYWHGGKLRKIVAPEQRIKVGTGSGGPTAVGDVAAAITALNDSVRQLELELRDRQGGGFGTTVILWVMVLLVMIFMAFQIFTQRDRGEMYPFMQDPKTGTPYYIELHKGKPPPEEKKPEEKPPEEKK